MTIKSSRVKRGEKTRYQEIKRIKCPNCKGSGKDIRMNTCKLCLGRGSVRPPYDKVRMK